MEKLTVVGGGLVGSLLTVFLAKKGFAIDVFERRPDMRKEVIPAGRSINLALSDRGWLALERAGIADSIRKISIPMNGRMLHDIQGGTSFLPYGKEGQAIYSVSRGELNKTLMEEAEKFPQVKYHFSQRCTYANLETGDLEFTETNSQALTKIKASRTIGTDGAYSEIRHRLQFMDRFDYSQTYLKDGYKELNIAPNADGSHKLDKNALHIWPRGRFMLIALPNLDGSFTCTLFFPFDEGEVNFSSLDSEEKVLAFFKTTFPDTLELIPDLSKQYMTNPTSSLVIIRCFPWSSSDKFLLLGDAAHGIVPFYGQGMNCGFEDCRILDEMMEEFDGDWKNLFKRIEKDRKPNSDAIAELALQNYIEMRDLVAKPEFVLRKKIEAKLSELAPDKWLPLYSMVTFSHLPYRFALDEGQKQEKIMQKVMQIPGIENLWTDDTFLKQEVIQKFL
jgi:kynurenine 3-monooxygenase